MSARLVVEIVVAAATLLAVLVALFGSWIRAQFRFLQPHLELEFQHEVSKTRYRLRPGDDDAAFADAIYFHAKVSNTNRKVAPAHQTQVFLVRQETRDAGGDFQISWANEIPVIWDYQQIKPLQKTLGPPDTVPVCSIVKDNWVEIHPALTPNNLKARWHEALESVAIVFVAKSIEAESDPLRLEIAWDGRWSDDKTELKKHLTVKVVPSSTGQL
jgi:hypothetical protein